MSSLGRQLQHQLVISKRIRGFGTTQHQAGVEKTLDELDVPFLLQERGQCTIHSVAQDFRLDLVEDNQL